MRTLRRWLTVAAVWAVAASAIAVIALLEARSEDEPEGPSPASESQLARVRDDLTKRIDELEQQITQLPATDDVRKLDQRLKKVEDAAADTRADVRKVRSDLDALTTRVEDVEQAQEDAAADDSADTDTTETTP